MRPKHLARFIDHSILKPNSSTEELEQGCLTARRLEVASVCLLPHYVRRCRELLAGSPVRTSTVVGFPHGGASLRAKLAETEAYLDDGAEELDVVVNVSLVVSGRFSEVREEVSALTSAVHERGQKLKLIFETCFLSRDQKIALCEIASEAGVDWVKTSTGFGTGGATVDDVRLMRAHCPPHVAVKASGGVSSLTQLHELLSAGANRIGCSRTEALLEEAGAAPPPKHP